MSCLRSPQSCVYVADLGHFNVQLTNPEIHTPYLVELREQGIEVTIFEAGPKVGGVYARPYTHPSSENASFLMTSSCQNTAFSSFPVTSEAKMWRADEYCAYLEEFAQQSEEQEEQQEESQQEQKGE